MIEFDDRGPLLVFGGPYSNLAATRALRAEAQRLGIPSDRVICTGDIVAYCAEPEETSALVRDWGIHVVAGNCEEQIAAGAADCGCNFEEGTACDLLSKGWYPFAQSRVSEETRSWMTGLPPTLRFRMGGGTFRVVHGGADAVSRWVFASTLDVIDDELERAGADVVIAGHCGLPFLATRPCGVWFNPGVIGMPANDGTPDVWYGLVESARGEISFSLSRLAYDYRSAAAAMRRFRYADGYARSLVTGLWPSMDVLPDVERSRVGKRIKGSVRRLALKRAENQRAALV